MVTPTSASYTARARKRYLYGVVSGFLIASNQILRNAANRSWPYLMVSILVLIILPVLAVLVYFRAKIVVTRESVITSSLIGDRNIDFNKMRLITVERLRNVVSVSIYSVGQKKPTVCLKSTFYDILQLSKVLELIEPHVSPGIVKGRDLLMDEGLKESIAVDKRPQTAHPVMSMVLGLTLAYLGLLFVAPGLALGFAIGTWSPIQIDPPLGVRLVGFAIWALAGRSFWQAYKDFRSGEERLYDRRYGVNIGGVIQVVFGIVILLSLIVPFAWVSYSAKIETERSMAQNRQRLIREASTHSYSIGPVLVEAPGTGMITTLAGGTPGDNDGRGRQAQFLNPSNLASDQLGNIYVVDEYNHRLRKVSPMGECTTLAGDREGVADGVGKRAKFARPTGLTISKTGTLYLCDTGMGRICQVTQDGQVTTIAGGRYYGCLDGKGASAAFKSPAGLVVNDQGYIFVADTGNNCIRKISPSGEVTTFAGGAVPGSLDGQGPSARFDMPIGMGIDRFGTIFVSDRNGIRKVSQSGQVTTMPISANRLVTTAFQITVASDNSLYVAGGGAVVRVWPNGMAMRLVGGPWGYSDGLLESARIGNPSGITLLPNGTIAVSDSMNSAIRYISPN